MLLEEAKQILNDNGYELLEEGKLARALGIGALALISFITGCSKNFDNDVEVWKDLKNATEEEIKNEFDNLTKDAPSLDYKIENNGIIHRGKGYTGEDACIFIPTKNIEGIPKTVMKLSFNEYVANLKLTHKTGWAEEYDGVNKKYTIWVYKGGKWDIAESSYLNPGEAYKKIQKIKEIINY